jgi:hypothetical protein
VASILLDLEYSRRWQLLSRQDLNFPAYHTFRFFCHNHITHAHWSIYYITHAHW